MGSHKTCLIVRIDAEISAKVRTSEALARRVRQKIKYLFIFADFPWTVA